MRKHTVEYLKKKAKGIKKVIRIPHHEALDVAARELGYQNYKDFLERGILKMEPPTGPPDQL